MNLTPAEIKPLTDLERAQFFEDLKGNLWLGFMEADWHFITERKIVLIFSGMILKMPTDFVEFCPLYC